MQYATLRDQFAMAVVQGITAHYGHSSFPHELAKEAYQIADAMMAEREKSTPKEEPVSND